MTDGPRQVDVRRVLRVYRDASDGQLAAGLCWYDDAHAAAARLDPANPRRAAGVIAALSPRMPWPRNLTLSARTYSEGRASGTLTRSCLAADAILAGADPLDVLQGPKVRAFFTLIAEPDHADAVCVDRHAIDVAVGLRLNDVERSAWYPLARRGLYERFAACYRRAAYTVGVRPAQIQAVTWLAWRAAHPISSTA